MNIVFSDLRTWQGLSVCFLFILLVMISKHVFNESYREVSEPASNSVYR